MSWLLLLPLFSTLAFAQAGIYPCGGGSGPGTHSGFNVSRSSCSTGNAGCVLNGCGIPNHGTSGNNQDEYSGQPQGTIANGMAYGWDGSISHCYTNPCFSTAEWRAINSYAAQGQSSLVNSNCTIFYAHGGGDAAPSNIDDKQWFAASGVPGPQQIMNGLGSDGVSRSGCNVIHYLYGLTYHGFLAADVSSGASSFTVTIQASHPWPADGTDVPFQAEIEGEIVTVTSQSTSGSTATETISGTFANNHLFVGAGSVPVFVGDTHGNWTPDASIPDTVCVLSVAAQKGWGNPNDFRLYGWSYGPHLVAKIRAMSASQKAAILTASNCPEAGGNTNWTITATSGASIPADMGSTVWLASSSGVCTSNCTQPALSAGLYGRGSNGATATDITKWATGMGVTCGAGGLTPTGATSLYTAAYNKGAQGNLAGSTTGDLGPVPAFLPPMNLVGGSQDGVSGAGVGWLQELCFALSASVPIVELTAGGSNGHGLDLTNCSGGSLWCSSSVAMQVMFKGLYVYDPNYGIIFASSAPAGPSQSLTGGAL